MNKTFNKDAIIQVDDELAVVVDKELQDSFCMWDFEKKKVRQRLTWKAGAPQATIIATIGKRIEGVPLIVLPEGDEYIWDLAIAAMDGYCKKDEHTMDCGCERWVEGFKAAQGRWTDKELKLFAAVEEALEHLTEVADGFEGELEQFRAFRQSLRKKLPTSITLEYDWEEEDMSAFEDENGPEGGTYPHAPDGEWILKIIPDEHGGIIHPVKVEY